MKDTHFYSHIREFAQRKAMIARQDAQAWDILARDISREKHRIEEQLRNKPVQPKMPPPEETLDLDGRLYVRVKEATKVMGMGRSSIYKEISEGRLPVTKRGRKTFIAMKDIHAWFNN